MLSNRVALLEYDVAGPVVVHERLILDHVTAEEYIVVTPDRDIFCEMLSVQNADLRAFRLRPAPNRLPPGVNAADIYPLPAWTVDELNAIKQEGAREAVAEKARRGLAGGAHPVLPIVPVVPGGAAGVDPAASGTPGADPPLSGELVWVAAECAGGKRYGERVDGVLAAAVVNARTIHTLADGTQLFCMCISEATTDDFNKRPSLCDGRLIGRVRNALGTPEIPLAEAVARSVEYDMGWKLVGPRTSKWCLNYLVVEGLGFEAHHERFRQLCRIESGTWGVQEHFQLSMMLRQIIQVDMMCGFNSLGVELMFRRLQTIEYAHSERARESEARNAGGKLALEEQYMFGSLVRQAGTLMIAPQLLQHVKEEVEKDVQLQKNLRKAKEERELAAKAKSKKNKGDENP